MIVKTHKTENGKLILAVCDNDLIGKKIIDKDLQLDLSSNFYKGKEMSEEEAKRLFRYAYIINLAGKKAVGLALKEGLLNKKNILVIKNIPHAQILIES